MNTHTLSKTDAQNLIDQGRVAIVIAKEFNSALEHIKVRLEDHQFPTVDPVITSETLKELVFGIEAVLSLKAKIGSHVELLLIDKLLHEEFVKLVKCEMYDFEYEYLEKNYSYKLVPLKPFCNGLKQVHKKLEGLKIRESFFINPLADGKAFLEEKHKQKLYEFEVGSIKYFAMEHQGTFSCETVQRTFTFFVKDGNTIHSAELMLYLWEWQFIVFGADAVNKHGYFALKGFNDRRKFLYVTSETMAEYLEPVEDELKEDIAEGLLLNSNFSYQEELKKRQDAVEKEFIEVTINHSGVWSNAVDTD
ncbi:hypothetical protein [Vibrio sp. D431a]|uniref:hypothetical protein n=1 Tax=Vibrio sp. D431a TaxID=2837388 RepID=UPI002556BDDB|nr:hypothetical protein [Vibrio sp. D431a]MDK9793722.1 hypothetical protein [Vibrio sp. D431a]